MKITLEKWKAEDFNEFFYASCDDELRLNMSDDFPKSLEECKQTVNFFSESSDDSECIRAIKVNGKIVGCISAFFQTGIYRKNAEIAYWLSADYRGKGIMTQVIKIFTENLFSLYDLHRIYAAPFEYNKASQRVLKKAGFHYEALLKENVFKNGSFISSALYALVR